MAKHGRYKIVRRVADGGMAEIFFATQLGRDGFQKPVILKRIHSTIYADPQFRNMFIDEAHISMSLAHSNIAQVLDLGVAAGRYFLVLELVDGWDLGRVLQRAAAANMPLPPELGLHVAADVCRALAYAHAKTDGERSLGIVHRDVSPHNILLSEQGEVKLTDFGIAKAMNKREHTGTGVVKGKVAFMSPEQAMGKPIDPRSDLFSLGTVLFLLMTRCRPFEGPTELETLLRVQKGDYPPPQALAPDLQPEVGEIIDRAMRLDPADRYQNADDMLADLERVLRSVFQPVGQTELKKWLADLSAADGILPITKTSEKAATGRSGTGELDGKDVVLSDSDEDVDAEAQTGLAVLDGGANGPVRISRQRPNHALPVPEDAETEQSGRSARIDFSLPVPEGEEPPGRRRKRRGSGLSILFVGALLVGGAWFAGKYARLWTEGGADGTRAPATTPAAADKVEPREQREPKAQKEDAKVAAKGKAEAKGDKADDKPDRKGDGERAREAAGDDDDKPVGPRRETASRRSRPGERQKDGPRRVDLKHLMAPDPSLLPAPAPAAPPTPPPSEPAPTPAPSDEP